MLIVELLAGWFGVSVIVGLVIGQILRRADEGCGPPTRPAAGTSDWPRLAVWQPVLGPRPDRRGTDAPREGDRLRPLRRGS